ncbi:gas vesicle protein GvpH [Natronococcus sp. A-GB7]|uniref:gas vesicle protein GvpH n=1 Tax=Natronococcus sp. A-GB7 TaxID=3037649 RepID=UPI0031BBB5FE
MERNQARKSESTDGLIDTRLSDGEFVVVADLPGANKEDLIAGIDSRTNELIIKKTGTTVGRVELPWSSAEMRKAWFKNGILEVYIRSDGTEPSEKFPFLSYPPLKRYTGGLRIMSDYPLDLRWRALSTG